MSRARTLVLGAAVWCAVVALGASLVWVVIDRAGRGVVPDSQPQADSTGVIPLGPLEAHLSPGATLSPRRTTGGHQRPTPSSGPSSPSSSTSSPTPPPATTPPGHTRSVTRQRRSWNGPAGHVVTECRGAAVRLVGAFPSTGWGYRLLDRGPGAVRVRYQRIGEDRVVTVTSRCVAGVPHFSESGGQPGDD